jgi:hypothetical protein
VNELPPTGATVVLTVRKAVGPSMLQASTTDELAD